MLWRRKAKDVGDYLDKLADRARARGTSLRRPWAEGTPSFDRDPAGGRESEEALGYRGPDPESDSKGDGDHEDQGT